MLWPEAKAQKLISNFFQDSEVSGRTIYSYYAIPYGKAPEGDLRFAPPQAAEPLNDGGYRFDGTYTTYLLGWINKVCPQAGMDFDMHLGRISNLNRLLDYC